MKYRVFARRWWRDNYDGTWPNNLEPEPCGIRHYLGTFSSEEAARERCRVYNETHSPGRYSVKAEYEGVST